MNLNRAASRLSESHEKILTHPPNPEFVPGEEKHLRLSVATQLLVVQSVCVCGTPVPPVFTSLPVRQFSLKKDARRVSAIPFEYVNNFVPIRKYI